ncbi:heat-inducible transcriptional repressor HrcA [Marinivivus vitaminiproducens]|uniref:heat-inducible transcriptional repressor HrcA n=1 Tax=Marinivivus vitaminiproducens TaxID=3035935 RepID=UPI0027A7A26D|nr:heat-inducible transcriptional repressor HrcA [Geminicoccaceae bacterium SCSIO 64248]
MISELNARSREVFRHIVDAYVETGEPVGSRTISRRLISPLSPASIRNVMADLEETGLLYAPHTSAGRLPTEAGLRQYVDGLLESGNLSEDEQADITSRCAGASRNAEAVLSDAIETLSGLSRAASLVMAPKTERPFKHVEFVALGPGRALVVVVSDNGMVENRVIDIPLDLPPSALAEAGNYLTARLGGRSFDDARARVSAEIDNHQTQLDQLTERAVQAGLAIWSRDTSRADEGILIVRGQAKLLEDVTRLTDLERVRQLFEALETKRNLLRILENIQSGAGVQVFIGAENPLFGLSGCSMVIAPYRAGGERHAGGVVGAIGVIGPARMNYARIVPMVDYTAQVVSRMLGPPELETST